MSTIYVIRYSAFPAYTPILLQVTSLSGGEYEDSSISSSALNLLKIVGNCKVRKKGTTPHWAYYPFPIGIHQNLVIASCGLSGLCFTEMA